METMMLSIKIYTKNNCPYCDMAKSLLLQKGLAFEEENYENDVSKILALATKTGMRTMPQIFIGQKLIGGYDDLQALEDQGLLDPMLNNEEE